MKSLQQQACEECTEMVQAVSVVLEKVKAAKRLGTLQEMQNELSALQMDLGSLRTKACEVKAHVCAAVVTMHSREVSDVVVPMTTRESLKKWAVDLNFDLGGTL